MSLIRFEDLTTVASGNKTKETTMPRHFVLKTLLRSLAETNQKNNMKNKLVLKTLLRSLAETKKKSYENNTYLF